MRAMILTVMSGILALNVGCGAILGRTFTEVKGAGAHAQELPGISPGTLRQYRDVRVGTPRSDVTPLVDPLYTRTLPGAVRTRLMQRNEDEKDKPPIFSGGTPVLELDPEITFYSRPGSVGGILGNDSYAVVLFWLRADGADIGQVQVVTKSGASRTGADDLARATAKGLAKFFDEQRNPKKESKRHDRE